VIPSSAAKEITENVASLESLFKKIGAILSQLGDDISASSDSGFEKLKEIANSLPQEIYVLTKCRQRLTDLFEKKFLNVSGDEKIQQLFRSCRDDIQKMGKAIKDLALFVKSAVGSSSNSGDFSVKRVKQNWSLMLTILTEFSQKVALLNAKLEQLNDSGVGIKSSKSLEKFEKV
jgi:hypothetical protein